MRLSVPIFQGTLSEDQDEVEFAVDLGMDGDFESNDTVIVHIFR